MGVMSCSRKECDNIMCDTYVSGIGYICWECQKQFKEYLTEKELNPKTVSDVEDELIKFLDYPKSSSDKTETTIDDFFKKHTRE